MTVTNNGQAPAELTTVTTAGADAADFAVAGGTCGRQPVLAAGARCTIDVEFTPGAVGPRTAELRIAADGESTTVALDGTGTGSILELEPAETDFGPWAVGSPAPDLREVRVRNLGNVPVPIARLDVQGDFPHRDGCAGNLIRAGGECTVQLRFLPQAEGPRTGRVVVTDGEGHVSTALLRGVGGAPHISVQPASLAFGSVPTGTVVERTLTVTNTGTWPTCRSGWATRSSPTCRACAAPGSSGSTSAAPPGWPGNRSARSAPQVPVVFWQPAPADGVAREYGFTGLPEACTVSGGPLG